MITEQQLELARVDFEKYFGNGPRAADGREVSAQGAPWPNGERATLKTERLGMEEVIIVENNYARAVYVERENGLVELKQIKKK